MDEKWTFDGRNGRNMLPRNGQEPISFRLFLTSGLVWVAANGFNGTTKPMSVLALACTGICGVLYVMLYRKNRHLVPA